MYDVLPIKVNGTVVRHKMELKSYRLGPKHGGNNRTLYTVYQAMKSSKFQDDMSGVTSFGEFLDIYCSSHNIDNPYTITPMNLKSRCWTEIVNAMVTDEDCEAVVRNVLNIAISSDRNAIKAAELIAQWMGANDKVSEAVEESIDNFDITPV